MIKLLSQGYKVRILSNTIGKFYMADTLTKLENTKGMSAKCLSILSVKMFYIFMDAQWQN